MGYGIRPRLWVKSWEPHFNVMFWMGKAFWDVNSHSNPYARKKEGTILRAVVLTYMEEQPTSALGTDLHFFEG